MLTPDTRYICMVAAMCMVLYGYDASVFNSIQSSNNWLNFFDLNTVSSVSYVPLTLPQPD